MGGISVGGAFGAGFGKAATDASINANNQISEVNARTGNKVRQASNAAAAAEGNLNRFVQSVNNNRRLKAGGDAQEALVVNAARMGDSQLAGRFSDSIRDAEQVGHAAASQAVNGVGGSVVDMVNTSTALRDSIVKQSVDDNQNAQSWDISKRAGVIASQMIGGLDSSVILDRLDYNHDVAQHQNKSGFFATVLNGFLANSVLPNNTYQNAKEGVKQFWDQNFASHETNTPLGGGGTQPSIDRMSASDASNPYGIFDEPIPTEEIPQLDMSELQGSW
jgi:hypothetical protein